MSVDTDEIRTQIAATPGELVAVDKAELHVLLDAVDHGRTAEQQLSSIRSRLAQLAIAA